VATAILRMIGTPKEVVRSPGGSGLREKWGNNHHL
jgi:hypothetical protein